MLILLRETSIKGKKVDEGKMSIQVTLKLSQAKNAISPSAVTRGAFGRIRCHRHDQLPGHPGGVD